MPLKESYVIWNNKGGVGKTTLTFHMATQYAKSNADVNVLVIDLCPQANISMALLSTPEQEGCELLASLYEKNSTVSLYLEKQLDLGAKVLYARNYLTCVNEYNKQVTKNVFLLCGDMCLELATRGLDYFRRGGDTPRVKPWKTVTTSIRSFIEGSEKGIEGVSQDDHQWVVFIDTNPSFSIYTEIALAAANKLIIPINADDFSKQAVRAMLDLVYGIAPEGQPDDFAAYRKYTFSHNMKEYKLHPPKIHLLINNRTTTIYKRSAKVFRFMGDENLRVLHKAYQQHSECFTPCEAAVLEDIDAFKKKYFADVGDFHTHAILSLHSGCPLGSLSGSVSFGEEANSAEVQVDLKKKKNYLTWLEEVVEML